MRVFNLSLEGDPLYLKKVFYTIGQMTKMRTAFEKKTIESNCSKSRDQNQRESLRIILIGKSFQQKRRFRFQLILLK